MNRKTFISKSILATSLSSMIADSCNNETNLSFNKFEGKRLIIIRLNGGNDGLHTMAPLKNELLQEKRPHLLKNLNSGIHLFSDWVLHPALKNLAELYFKGWLHIVPNVGLPELNTSHFKSSEIWETGYLPADKDKTLTGWVARKYENSTKNILGFLPILNIDRNQWLVNKGERRDGIQWIDKTAWQWFGDRMERFKKSDLSIYSNLFNIENYFNILGVLSNIKLENDFSNTEFGQQLARISSIIKNEIPFEVLHAVQSGYDTHLGQEKRLFNLYTELSHNLNVLCNSLNDANIWKDTLVLVYSEFGRTVDENVNGGTDHGTAGPVFMLSGDLKNLSQPLNKTKPELNFTNIGQDMYLDNQVDFREIINWVSGIYLK